MRNGRQEGLENENKRGNSRGGWPKKFVNIVRTCNLHKYHD